MTTEALYRQALRDAREQLIRALIAVQQGLDAGAGDSRLIDACRACAEAAAKHAAMLLSRGNP